MEPVILVRRFLRDTRAGATVIAAAALAVMTLGGAALITDHLWLVDQRDTLKSAADSASIAATLEMNRKLAADPSVSDEVLREHVEGVARRYIELNLSHLPAARLTRAKETLDAVLVIDRAASRVGVAVEADLGGTIVARALPLLGGYTGPDAMEVATAVKCAATPIEVVLALDVTSSMHGKIDENLPKGSDNRRLNAVLNAAKALVRVLGATCDESSVAVGVVPWDKTVRVPGRGHVAAKRLGEYGGQPYGLHPDGLGGMRRGSRTTTRVPWTRPRWRARRACRSISPGRAPSPFSSTRIPKTSRSPRWRTRSRKPSPI